MEKKMTQKEYYEVIVKALKGEEVAVPVDEMVEFINGRVTALEKKATNKKATKTQEENEKVKADMLDVLEGGSLTATEIMNALAETYPGISIQKVSALIRILEKDEKKIVRTIDGKKTKFSLA